MARKTKRKSAKVKKTMIKPAAAKTANNSQKNAGLKVSSTIFGIVALLHFLVFVTGNHVTTPWFEVPNLMSLVIAVFLGYISWWTAKLSK